MVLERNTKTSAISTNSSWRITDTSKVTLQVLLSRLSRNSPTQGGVQETSPGAPCPRTFLLQAPNYMTNLRQKHEHPMSDTLVAFDSVVDRSKQTDLASNNPVIYNNMQ